MTIKKIMKKSSLISSIKLGRGSYTKATNMPSTLQPVAKQNSLLNVAGVLYKYYKTT